MSDFLSTGTKGGIGRDAGGDETASDKLEGTPAYDTSGKELGSIHTAMIGKQDGHMACAVLSFGGFLRMGRSFYALPWQQLTYSRDHGGYVINLTKAVLAGAPKYDFADSEAWSGGDRRGSVDTHYARGAGSTASL